jgi:hypothetical protein
MPYSAPCFFFVLLADGFINQLIMKCLYLFCVLLSRFDIAAGPIELIKACHCHLKRDKVYEDNKFIQS